MGKSVTQSGLICPECGSTFTIWRHKGSQRELYHKKFLYCITCQKVTNHIELHNIDEYLSKIKRLADKDLTQEERHIKELIKKRSE